jgi:paraquat-inducible protein B
MQGLIRDLRKDLAPLTRRSESALATAQKALETADATMRKFQGTLETTQDFTAPDSNLDQAIVELRETARAVRDLADYLERKPNSLVFGRQ